MILEVFGFPSLVEEKVLSDILCETEKNWYQIGFPHLIIKPFYHPDK